MSNLAMTGQELLQWSERTADGWRLLAETRPDVLTLPCDIYGVATVGELLRHIVAVELRYAQRLAGVDVTAYDAIGFGAGGEIFSAHALAVTLFKAELADGGDWDRTLEFQTLHSGRVRATRKTVFFHALLHGIRHYAQLATLVRQHGIKPGWGMDYLAMGAERLG